MKLRGNTFCNNRRDYVYYPKTKIIVTRILNLIGSSFQQIPEADFNLKDTDAPSK